MVARTLVPSSRGNVFWPGVVGQLGSVPGDVFGAEAIPAATIGTGIATGATLSTLAVPIAGAVAAAGLLIYSWISRRNAQKVAATSVVNEAEPYLLKNLEAFQAIQNPTATDQAAALQYFDAVWAQVVKECGQIGGGGGERCVTDRQAGACVWGGAGNCWNWFTGYRDPIANAAVSSPTAVESLTGSLGIPTEVGGISTTLIIAVGLIAIGVAS